MSKSNNLDDTSGIKDSKSLSKLYRLIAALSAMEKNVFRRHIRNYSASNNQEAQYIKLFDCVNDAWLETEREIKSKKVKLPRNSTLEIGTDMEVLASDQIFFEKFKSRFRIRAFANPSELGKMANYLYGKILESLRSNNPEQSIRRDLQALMLDIQLLYYKELYDECLSQLKVAKVLAKRIEAIPFLLDLLRTERRILVNTRKWQSLAQMREIFKQEQWLLQQLDATTTLFDLHIETLIADSTKMRIDEDEELKSKINKHLDYLRNENRPENDAFELKMYLHATSAILSGMASDSPFLHFLKHKKQADILEHFKQIVELHEQNPDFKTEDPIRYRVFVVNYLSLAFGAGMKQELEKYGHLLESVDPSDPEFLRNVVYINLLGYIKNKDFAQAQQYLNEHKIWDLMQKYGNQLPVSRRQVLCYSAGTIFFVREDFRQASNWFSASLEDKSGAANAKVQVASAFFDLIAQFELGETHSHPRKKLLLRPLVQCMAEAKIGVDSLEHFLADSFYRILKLDNDKKALRLLAAELFQETKARLEERRDLSHYDLYLGWLESKDQEKPLRFTVDKYI